jgi:hypothetical protein
MDQVVPFPSKFLSVIEWNIVSVLEASLNSAQEEKVVMFPSVLMGQFGCSEPQALGARSLSQ